METEQKWYLIILRIKNLKNPTQSWGTYQANWSAAKMILPIWFDYLEASFFLWRRPAQKSFVWLEK